MLLLERVWSVGDVQFGLKELIDDDLVREKKDRHRRDIAEVRQDPLDQLVRDLIAFGITRLPLASNSTLTML